MHKLIYIFITIIILGCSADNENPNITQFCSDESKVYLDDNGITIKACEDASIGETGTIDGVIYTIVDELTLRSMVDSDLDVTKVVTSRITNMRSMFKLVPNFNQNISSWDVSSVTDMEAAFKNTTNFNQPIDNWDVSNVISMKRMFMDAEAINQDLSSWNVINTENCLYFYKNAIQWVLPKPNLDPSCLE